MNSRNDDLQDYPTNQPTNQLTNLANSRIEILPNDPMIERRNKGTNERTNKQTNELPNEWMTEVWQTTKRESALIG